MRRRSQGGAGPLLRRWLGHASILLLAIVMTAVAAYAAEDTSTDRWPRGAVPASERHHASSHSSTRSETLWIFDADFEDLVGDNAGWMTDDASSSPERVNYWHKDTIRINGFAHLADSTWWCGTYDACWRQPRGYGNNWMCILEREFPEVATGTEPGDVLTLEYDQRYAMEKDYDYGYVDVSTDGGDNWTTVHSVTNAGWMDTPGTSEDWDSTDPVNPGHMLVDLSEYVGETISIRFRFESDGAYSSQDQYNNHPMMNSCLDGAWQLDNIRLWAAVPETVGLFFDNCESPGDNGWVTEDVPASGQTGVVYRRSHEEFGGHTGWMMAAYDTVSGTMVPGQHSRLYSPPIYIAGASELVAQCEGWLDLPSGSGYRDYVGMSHMESNSLDCVERHLPKFPYGDWFLHDTDPEWVSVVDSILYTSGDSDWLGLLIQAVSHDDPDPHGMGFVLDRIRVGVLLHTGVPDDSDAEMWVSHAHPNPFGDLMTIEYGLRARDHVRLRVFDLSGRIVTTLMDGEVDPGEHRAVWDGTTDSGESAASGIYFVRLEANGASGPIESSRKLVLLK